MNSEIEKIERPSPTGWFYPIIIKQELRRGWRTYGTRTQNDTGHTLLSQFFFLFIIFRPVPLYCDFAQSVYELPLLPTNNVSETFFTQIWSGAKCWLDIYNSGCRPDGDIGQKVWTGSPPLPHTTWQRQSHSFPHPGIIACCSARNSRPPVTNGMYSESFSF